MILLEPFSQVRSVTTMMAGLAPDHPLSERVVTLEYLQIWIFRKFTQVHTSSWLLTKHRKSSHPSAHLAMTTLEPYQPLISRLVRLLPLYFNMWIEHIHWEEAHSTVRDLPLAAFNALVYVLSQVLLLLVVPDHRLRLVGARR